jgi:hypothetical protein
MPKSEQLPSLQYGSKKSPGQVHGTVEAFTLFVKMEVLTKEAVDLLIDKIAVHGERDIEII